MLTWHLKLWHFEAPAFALKLGEEVLSAILS